MKTFALIGAAGYIAPRHMHAMKELGHQLVAAFDRHDSVGVLDKYFPGAAFFTEFERFDRHLEKLKRAGQQVDYISVCSPNYLHDAHIRFGLRYGADLICEKPVVLNPWNIQALIDMTSDTESQVHCILQLRLHPEIIQLKQRIDHSPSDEVFDVDLTYITARGQWYYASWKGDESKSGGITTNIGIHFFDVLIWLFGSVQSNVVHLRTHDRATGILRLERATVRWFLSINGEHLSPEVVSAGASSLRTLTISGDDLALDDGFELLHVKSYQRILEGRGFTLEDAEASLILSHDIRKVAPVGLAKESHPLASLPMLEHPFKQ